MKKLLLVLFVLAATAATTLYKDSSVRAKTQLPPKAPVEKQDKEHARKVYKGLGDGHRKLTDAASTGTGDISGGLEVGLPVLSPFAPPFNLREFLKTRACAVDVIVVGKVKSKSARLTEDETFVFTDYVLSVEDVLKNNDAEFINSGGDITVTRAGGVINLRGRKVTAEHQAVKLLEENQRYLLFLTFVPDKSAYVANDIGFLLQNNKIVKLTRAQAARELESGNDASAFIDEVRAATGEPCGEAGTQQEGAQ